MIRSHVLNAFVLASFVVQTSANAQVDPVKAPGGNQVLSRATKGSKTTTYQTVRLQDLTQFTPASIPLDKYGGRTDQLEKASGFFYVAEKADGWIMVDPDGHPFVCMGVNSVSSNAENPDTQPTFIAKHKTKEAWAEATHRLLTQELHFNTLGCWSDAETFQSAGHPMPYTRMWNFAAGYGRQKKVAVPGVGHTKFDQDCIPVFDPEFKDYCQSKAPSIKATANDTWLLGHFSDNELPLKQEKIIERYLALPEGDSGHQAAKQWLESNKKTLKEVTAADDREFCRIVLTRYYQIVHDVLKQSDPNHMVIGSRLHGSVISQDVSYEASGKYVDVLSLNYYHRWSVDQEQLSRCSRLSGKPIIISEWYAKGMDSGLKNTSGAGFNVPTQADRAAFYENFTLGLLHSRCVVGWHWFRYIDNGPSFKEDSANKGIVNVKYEPYPPLAESMKAINQGVYSLQDYLRPLKSENFPKKPKLAKD